MWRESESEPVRLQRVLAHNGLVGEELARKFRSAPREDVRLAAALRGYFVPGCADDAQRAQYLIYLSHRLRPAVTALIEENRVLDIAALERQTGFSRELTDEFLQTAIAMGRPEVIVWLLRFKQSHWGFQDRDFSL